MLAKISSADLVQTNGVGSSLWMSMYSRMAASSSLTLRNTPRRIRLLVSSANQRSIRLIHQFRIYQRAEPFQPRQPGVECLQPDELGRRDHARERAPENRNRYAAVFLGMVPQAGCPTPRSLLRPRAGEQ